MPINHSITVEPIVPDVVMGWLNNDAAKQAPMVATRNVQAGITTTEPILPELPPTP